MGRGESAHKDFSHYRIVIEQTIGKIKTFGACRERIRTHPGSDQTVMHLNHEKCWTIASAFVNEYYQVTTAI